MLSTLAEAKASGLLKVAGVSPTSQAFIDFLNEATSRLLRRGDWPGTVVSIQLCATRGCATFPRYVDQIRKINVCNTPLDQHNMYWSFMPKDTYNCITGCAASWLGNECSMTVRSRVPTYQDIWGETRYIRAYVSDIRDVNATITLFGTDNNSQPYQETLTLSNPYVQSSRYVRSIDRILKDRTKGRVFLRCYNATNGSIEELSTLEATETNPSLLRVSLNIPSCSQGSCTSGSCPTAMPIAALVKFRFVPVVDDTDLVLIENLDALKDMVQSLRCGEQGDVSGKAQFEASAIRELNLQTWNEFGDDQFSIRIDPFNRTNIGQQQTF